MPGMPAGLSGSVAPAGSITPSQLAAQAAQTVLGNPTGSSASPIATPAPVVSGSMTAARFLASTNATAAAPSVLVEPAGNSGLFWNATNGVVLSVDAVERIRAMVSGVTQFISPGSGTAVTQRSAIGAGNSNTYIRTSSPEGSQTASPGDDCFDITNGRYYLKRSGTGNTGWVQIDRCESGTWTPTTTNVSNLDATTPAVGIWLRVGDAIHFTVPITVDPTAAGAFQFRFTPPVASNFAASTDAGGVGSAAATLTGRMTADTTNDAILVDGNAPDGAARTYAFTGTMRVL